LGSTDYSYKLPKAIVIITILVSIIPFFLAFIGVDFSTNELALGTNDRALEQSFRYLKGAFAHTMLEWTAFSLALITCFLAFTDFAIKRDPATPVIGVALLCAGLMDAFHTLAAVRLVDAVADNSDLIPFTWALCRMFNSLICVLGVGLFLFTKKLSQKNSVSIIAGSSLVFLVSAYVAIYIASTSNNLPATQFPGDIITRPYDILPLLIYMVSGYLFYRFYKLKPGPFSHALVLSSIPNIATQLYMAFGSAQLFDNYFYIGHFTKIVSYALPFIGLCWGYIAANKEKERLNQEMLSINHTLDLSSLVSEANSDGVITYVNDNFVKTTKYSREELLGKSYKLIAHGGDESELHHELVATRNKREITKGEFKCKNKDGQSFWVEAAIAPTFTPTGEIERFTAIKYDITDKKLAESRMIEAMQRSEELARSKGQFLANMSHEIRTPMNGILGMITLLNDTKLSPKQNEMLETVKSCGDGLMTVLNDILDFSKVESGKLDLELSEFDLRKCVDEVLYLSSYRASQKKIDLVSSIEDDTPNFLIGDITRIRQVLVNLLSNAVKFTEEGEIKLSVMSKKIGNNKREILFKVIDSGIGIKKEDQSKLFNAFAQADATITRKFGGTGLGLSISTKLAQAMGGSIELDSEFGKGSVFTLVIPLSVGDGQKITEAVDEPLEDIVEPVEVGACKQHKILVVEDNAINQKLAMLMLKKLGYSCDIAANGLEALKALKVLEEANGGSYSLIFMDMQMPEMDGITATKKIIETYGDDRPVIVAMTANVYAEDKQRCMDAGMDDFIEKPININSLKRVLS